MLSYFLEPFFNIFGSSPTYLSLTMSLLSSSIIFSFFIIFRHFSNRVIALVLSFPLIAITYISSQAAGGYFQVFPLRYLNLSIVLILFFWVVKYGPNKWRLFYLGVGFGLVALNNIEWGLVSVLFTSTVLFSWLYFNSTDLFYVFKKFTFVFLGFIVLVLLFSFCVHTRSGFLPDYKLLFSFLFLIGNTANLVPLTWIGIWVLFASLFSGLLIFSIPKIIRARDPILKSNLHILLLVDLLGFIPLFYFFGRSLWPVLYASVLWWGFSIILLVLFLLNLYSWKNFKFKLIEINPFLLIIAFSFSLVLSSLIYLPDPHKDYLRITEGDRPDVKIFQKTQFFITKNLIILIIIFLD